MTTDQPDGLPPLSEAEIDLIANDGMRNAAGGIYATRVYEFARAVESESRAPLLAELAALRAEVDALRVDAARLDHLQSSRLGVYAIQHVERRQSTRADGSYHRDIVFDGWGVGTSAEPQQTVRAAIDQSLGKQDGSKG